MTSTLELPPPAPAARNTQPNTHAPRLWFDNDADADALAANPNLLEDMARERLQACHEIEMSLADITRACGISKSTLIRIRRGGKVTRAQAEAILTVRPTMSETALMRREWAHFRLMGGTPDEVRRHLVDCYGWDERALTSAARLSTRT